MTMKVGSLFTGYGGLDIAVGGDLAWYAEIEPAACQVLAYHYPNVPNLGDITKIDWSEVEPVDVITGGYPCQPFSHAGNRKGKNDVRHLWPNVLDAIRAIRPRYAILENVSGHLTLGFADVLADLAEIGWSCEWGTFRASDVGAPHRRERIFIIAHTNSERSQGHNGRDKETPTRGYGLDQQRIGAPAADASCERHGIRERSRRLERMGSQAEVSGWETSTARQEFGAGSVDDAADADNEIGCDPQERLCTKPLSGSDCSADTESNEQREPAELDGLRPELGNGFDARSVRLEQNGQDAADAESKGLQRREPAAKDYEEKLAGRRTTPQRNCDAADTKGARASKHDSGLREISAGSGDGSRTEWGKYAPAIRRWESVLERNAPDPVVMRSDKRRLNPRFVEWMMGLPDGWVTGHGLSAAKELKMLGNGVVPQQAHAAITQLLERTQQ